MSQTSIHVYCSFNGLRLSVPFRTSDNYKQALDLAIRLVGPDGRAQPDAGSEEMFYLYQEHQLEALFNLQRALKK